MKRQHCIALILDDGPRKILLITPFIDLSGADPGFLEKGVDMYKKVGVRYADLSHFFKYHMKMK